MYEARSHHFSGSHTQQSHRERCALVPNEGLAPVVLMAPRRGYQTLTQYRVLDCCVLSTLSLWYREVLN